MLIHWHISLSAQRHWISADGSYDLDFFIKKWITIYSLLLCHQHCLHLIMWQIKLTAALWNVTVVRVNEHLLVEPCERQTTLWDTGTLFPPSPDISIPSNAKAEKTLPSLAGEAVNLFQRLIRTIKASSVHYLFLLNCQMMSFQTEASGRNVTTWSVTNHRMPQLDSCIRYSLVDGYGWGQALLYHVRDSSMGV